MSFCTDIEVKGRIGESRDVGCKDQREESFPGWRPLETKWLWVKTAVVLKQSPLADMLLIPKTVYTVNKILRKRGRKEHPGNVDGDR